MPGGKGGKTKHDRCVEGVREGGTAANPHAVCVAAGVRPAKWNKANKSDDVEKGATRNRGKEAQQQSRYGFRSVMEEGRHLAEMKRQREANEVAPVKSIKPKDYMENKAKLIKALDVLGHRESALLLKNWGEMDSIAKSLEKQMLPPSGQAASPDQGPPGGANMAKEDKKKKMDFDKDGKKMKKEKKDD